MCIGPQAYAYANGNPLRYSDPTGLYFVDATWRFTPPAYRAAVNALDDIKNDKLLCCFYKKEFGSLPFGRNAPISRSEIIGLWPWSAVGQNNPFGSHIWLYGPYVDDIAAGQKSFSLLRGLLAHEITHEAYGVTDLDPRPEIAEDIATGLADGTQPRYMQELRKCCE